MNINHILGASIAISYHWEYYLISMGLLAYALLKAHYKYAEDREKEWERKFERNEG